MAAKRKRVLACNDSRCDTSARLQRALLGSSDQGSPNGVLTVCRLRDDNGAASWSDGRGHVRGSLAVVMAPVSIQTAAVGIGNNKKEADAETL